MNDKTKNNNDVRIVSDVTKECRKSLKILAIQKDTTLPLIVKDIPNEIKSIFYKLQAK